jgi:AcrR family transcriptional regulator
MAPKAKRLQPDTTDASTRDALIEAAAREFNTAGFHGTNTNLIARAAGFAPQTFYRHFADKTDIFLAVYAFWQARERQAVAQVLNADPKHHAIAKVALDHHLEWKIFRRSLRFLAVSEERVRQARAASRARQLEALAKVPENAQRTKSELAGALLALERLCDAAADGEFDDLGIAKKDVLALVAGAVRQARGGG